jgi:hypothetical protein
LASRQVLEDQRVSEKRVIGQAEPIAAAHDPLAIGEKLEVIMSCFASVAIHD